jgi:hypothetical protein
MTIIFFLLVTPHQHIDEHKKNRKELVEKKTSTRQKKEGEAYSSLHSLRNK